MEHGEALVAAASSCNFPDPKQVGALRNAEAPSRTRWTAWVGAVQALAAELRGALLARST